ncbi:MAG: hypothetical protein HQL27_04115 [Candidatus Omnitrophica bacterium]|nr:hypothetical protein [Candidatus Omnitrophota bacterium]
MNKGSIVCILSLIIMVSLLGLFISVRVYAGDCFSHPMFIYDIEIDSCAKMSEENAGQVSSSIASPKVIAERYPGIILQGHVKAVRQIDLDEPFRGIKFAVHPWLKKDDERLQPYLYSGKSVANGCEAFKHNSRIKFASFTNCECDTAPSSDGYCALTVKQIYDIPDAYTKYSSELPESSEKVE